MEFGKNILTFLTILTHSFLRLIFLCIFIAFSDHFVSDQDQGYNLLFRDNSYSETRSHYCHSLNYISNSCLSPK